MIEKIRSYIDKEIALDSSAQVLIALSGGADSTALLLIMKELGYRLHALHCNFHLRDEESNRDQTFVEELCKQQQVPLSVRHFETKEYAAQHGISIEMAARNLRYEWFRNEMSKQKASCVAVAHHRDDQSETLLLNLLRGTGLRGLAGIMPVNEDGIIRPLLCLSRKEILNYLKSRGQSYVTDSTNAELICQRNRLRLDVIPLLREINPAVVEHICLASNIVRQSIPYYLKGIKDAFKELKITEESYPLSALSSPTLLHEWLAGKGFNGEQEEEMLLSGNGQPGKMWHSKNYSVLRDRETLVLATSAKPMIPQIHQEIVARIEETGSTIAYFDADLITHSIEVRPVREGDTFVPFGMTGRKLVSDFLTDLKLNRFQKASTFVAISGENIIWLIGHRSDNRFRVTDRTTRILKLTCNC